MKNFLVRDALVPALAATTKEGAIRELVGALQGAGYFRPTEVEPVVAEVLRREGLGSTGIGRGVAPHAARHRAIRLLSSSSRAAANASCARCRLAGADIHAASVFICATARTQTAGVTSASR